MVNTVLLKLTEFEAWICGLRQDQTVMRTDIKKSESDATHGLVKINPLGDWTAVDVWDSPASAIFLTTSCTMRSFPPSEALLASGRSLAAKISGREPDKKECGLHIMYEAVKQLPAEKSFGHVLRRFGKSRTC